jgi:hypothetical protein
LGWLDLLGQLSQLGFPGLTGWLAPKNPAAPRHCLEPVALPAFLVHWWRLVQQQRAQPVAWRQPVV